MLYAVFFFLHAMVKIPDKIAIEHIQRLTPYQAWEYKLVPYGEENGFLRCYGAEGPDTGTMISEVEVLTGMKIDITPIEHGELVVLLQQYYRNPDSMVRSPMAAANDKFLVQLIEEAFHNYASDIHIESYEERCRVRFRIDGKLVERYVLEPQSYPALVNQIKIMANLDISEKRLPQDGRIFYQLGKNKFDLRVSSLPAIYGEKIVLRLLPRHVELLDLGNLGFSERQLSDYLSALKHFDVVIGNSSSAIIEAPSFGIPSVNIGDRQKGRIRAESTIDCAAEANEIACAIKYALSDEFRANSKKAQNPYAGNGDAAAVICDVLAKAGVPTRGKAFYDIEVR